MRRRASRASSAGLLLVEAVVAAVLIGGALAAITRGLSSHLKTLRRLQDYDLHLALAHQKLLELETDRLAQRPVSGQPRGAFDDPYQTYRWALTSARLVDSATGEAPTTRVELSILREPDASHVFSVVAIWPSAWIPDEWL